MTIIFDTERFRKKYFLYFSHTEESLEANSIKVTLDSKFKPIEDFEETNVYQIKVTGVFTDEPSEYRQDSNKPHQVNDLKTFRLVYVPSRSSPSLYAINIETTPNQTAKLDISDFKKFMPDIESLFFGEIAPEDLPDYQ